MTKLSNDDLFQVWLMEMDNAITGFIESVPPGIGEKLDGSVESLDELESLVLARFPSVEDAKKPDATKFLDGSARYAGEVLRKLTGSKWAIRHDDPKFAFYGLPILLGGSKLGDMPECPLTLITAAIDRRKGTYLSTIVRNLAE